MEIRGIDLGRYPLLLAPMEGVSDSAFRKVCRRYGASMVYSEFVSADALIRSVRGATQKLFLDPMERPAVVQIYGREVETMVEAARIASQVKPDILDLNFGCPVKRVAGKGAGSGLLRNIPLLLEITRAVVEAVEVPVSVKTRLGWDHNSIIIEELAEELQSCGIVALTIHGRTRSDMYTGEADWAPIARVKANPKMKIPIIGNGDVTTGRKAWQAFHQSKVDAVMIGRGAIGRPWIFQEIRHYLATGEEGGTPSIEEQYETLLEMVRNNIQKLDERRGILHSRRHLALTPLFKGIPNFRPLRIRMLRAETLEELLDTLKEVKPLLAEKEEEEAK